VTNANYAEIVRRKRVRTNKQLIWLLLTMSLEESADVKVHEDTVELSGLRLQWRHDLLTNRGTLSPQTKAGNILTALAELNRPDVSRLALEIVWSNSCCDGATHLDALRAYSQHPLADPPAAYVRECYDTDWEMTPAAGFRTIVLVGLNSRRAQQEMLRALRAIPVGLRDDAICAASGFRDAAVVELIIQLAMETDVHDAHMTGEYRAFADCFRAWKDGGVISVCDLKRQLERFRDVRSEAMKRSLLNTIVAPGWEDLPYPELAGSRP
jgi:hypothetical protein